MPRRIEQIECLDIERQYKDEFYDILAREVNKERARIKRIMEEHWGMDWGLREEWLWDEIEGRKKAGT